MRDNLIADTDSYKPSHWPQYPPGTSYMFSYLESRGGKYASTLFFGLQPILERFEKGFTMEDVEEMRELMALHGEPFNYEGWKRMYEKYKGKLPVRIKAVPEGTIVPTKNILMSIESTDPEFFWVVNWLETQLMRIWYPITVATQSWTIKQIIRSFLERTSDDPEAELPFKLHDFGSRGVSSRESAGIGGSAHLVNFMGSDTIEGVRFANAFYSSKISGFSIPASEHSTMTMWGRDNEAAAMANMIDVYGGEGKIYACVSDQYDIKNAVENIWGGVLREKLIAKGGTLVIRPDSGDPVQVLTELCKIAEEKFGCTYNNKGYKVFNHVRFIWGDGINEDTIRAILTAMTNLGYSATNYAFGMGGALLQQVNRDTQKFAFKCSYAIVDGKGVDVFKDPVTDHGKASKRGKLDLVTSSLGGIQKVVGPENGRFLTVQGEGYGSVLKTVFENGKIKVKYTLDEIRKRSQEF